MFNDDNNNDNDCDDDSDSDNDNNNNNNNIWALWFAGILSQRNWIILPHKYPVERDLFIT